LRKTKGEGLCGRCAGEVKDRRLIAREDGLLTPAAPLRDRGRRGIGGDGRFEGRQVGRMADYAAMVAIPVVVGVNRNGCGGLDAGKASQQEQNERRTDPANGNAVRIGPVQ